MEKKEENGHRKPSFTARFSAWRKRHVSDSVTLVVVAAAIGILAGFGAFLLKFFIGHITTFVTKCIQVSGHTYWLLIVPVVGIIIVSCYQRYILKQNLMHGTDRLNKDLKARRYRLPGDLTYAPMLASTVTLGLGGSAGAEGPIATTGAAIGSNLGRILGLSPAMIRILIGCGAGAGIAGIFKSPIGGALFTLEVLKMPMTTLSVLALVIAAVCGSLTCYICTGFTPDVNFISVVPFDPSWIGWIIGLGLFCGLYSVYYGTVVTRMGRYFGRMRNPWLMNILGGVILSFSIFMFPILYGEGYSVVTEVVNGNFSGLARGSIFENLITDNTALILLVGGVLLCKCWA
ncbi:MAG: chloride channel protein, partial [Muribaculaceae bacterium]|nr:chloride channel protein [Muribaculaceae bacterium]